MYSISPTKILPVVLLIWFAVATPIKVTAQNHATQWTDIRDTDTLWKKRIWREIDVYNPQNKVLRSGGRIKPELAFANVLMAGIKEGKLTAYADTFFKQALLPASVGALTACNPLTLSANGRMYLNYLARHQDDSMEFNTELPKKKRLQKGYLDKYDSSAVSSCVFPQQVDCYQIVEDWIFDKKQNKMVVRIVSIAPATKVAGNKKYLFWIKYPEWRDYLSNFDIPTDDKKMQLSWEEYFDTRQFSSLINFLEE